MLTIRIWCVLVPHFTKRQIEIAERKPEPRRVKQKQRKILPAECKVTKNCVSLNLRSAGATENNIRRRVRK